MADGTTDVSGPQQFCICFRYIEAISLSVYTYMKVLKSYFFTVYKLPYYYIYWLLFIFLTHDYSYIR